MQVLHIHAHSARLAEASWNCSAITSTEDEQDVLMGLLHILAHSWWSLREPLPIPSSEVKSEAHTTSAQPKHRRLDGGNLMELLLCAFE